MRLYVKQRMKMKNIFYILELVIVGLFVSSISNAQTLTPEQCRKLALENNRQIKQAQLTKEKQTFDTKTYKSNFYPRINAFAADLYSTAKGSFTMNGGNLPIFELNSAVGQYVPKAITGADGRPIYTEYAYFPDQELELKVKNILMAGVTLTQPIFMGGKITTAYRMSQIGEQMASLNKSLTEDQVIVETDEAYALVIKAKEMINVANKYKDLLTELNKNVESAVRHGMKTRNDQMKVQVKINEADLNILKAENGFKLAKMNLCHVIGLPITQDIDVICAKGTDSPTLMSQSSDYYSIDNRYEYEILNKKVELADNEVKLTKSDYLPNVVVMGGVSYTNGLELAGEKLMNGVQGSVGIGVKIPIVTFGENTNKLRSAKAKAQIARLEQDDLNEKMRLELQQAINNMNEAKQELLLTENALKQNDENVRLARQQYDVGYEPLSDLLEAQALWQQASANRVEAECQYRICQLKVLKASGQISSLKPAE